MLLALLTGVHAGMLSMMVLVVAIVCMVVVTQCLNRPLSLVVRYMSAVSQMGKHKGGHNSNPELSGPPHTLSRSAEQLRQLKEIYAKWKDAVTIQVDDRDLEISRVGYSSRSVAKEGSRESRSGNMRQQQQAAHGSYASTSSRNSANTASAASSLSQSDVSAATTASPRRKAWWTRLIDRSAVCLMREVEDMQFTFHSMLHQLTKSTQELEEANDAKRHFVATSFTRCACRSTQSCSDWPICAHRAAHPV